MCRLGISDKERIFLQGENLLPYFDAHAYSVNVGDKECTELTVVNNLITCRPPQDEPDIYSEVQVILSIRERHKIFMSLQNCIHMDESENLINSKDINTYSIYWHLTITSSNKHAFQSNRMSTARFGGHH